MQTDLLPWLGQAKPTAKVDGQAKAANKIRNGKCAYCDPTPPLPPQIIDISDEKDVLHGVSVQEVIEISDEVEAPQLLPRSKSQSQLQSQSQIAITFTITIAIRITKTNTITITITISISITNTNKNTNTIAIRITNTNTIAITITQMIA
jgi:hypothetical protein